MLRKRKWQLSSAHNLPMGGWDKYMVYMQQCAYLRWDSPTFTLKSKGSLHEKGDVISCQPGALSREQPKRLFLSNQHPGFLPLMTSVEPVQVEALTAHWVWVWWEFVVKQSESLLLCGTGTVYLFSFIVPLSYVDIHLIHSFPSWFL